MKRSLVCRAGVLLAVAAFSLWLIGTAAFAAGPTGLSPYDPMMVPVDITTVAPSTTLWFYFDYAVTAPGGRPTRGSKPPAQVAVDANGAPGLAFAIFTRAQIPYWLGDPTTTPVGNGTPYEEPGYTTITHDLYWAGGFNTSDRYLIAVTNSSAAPVAFHLTVTGDTVTLYPPLVVAPTPTLRVPFTLTPVPMGTIQGKVVFVTTTGGDIYTVNGDGSNLARVSRGIDPAWSPDGKQITFTRWDNTNPGLFVANADGSNERLVYTAPQVRWPRWSPDGRYIAFTQNKTKVENSAVWKLGVVEVATGKLNEPQCSQLCFVPSWGKDGASLVYIDPNIAIMRTNAFGGQESILGPLGTYFDAGANITRPIVHWPPIQSPQLSPDGTRVVYSMQAIERWELNMMDANGKNANGITRPDPVMSLLFDQVIHNVAPVWSADSKQILFLSDRNGKWEFFVTDPNGAVIRQVLKNVTDSISVKFGYDNERTMDWTR